MILIFPIFRFDTNDDNKPLLIGIASTRHQAYDMLEEYKSKHDHEGEFEYTVTPKPLNRLFE